MTVTASSLRHLHRIHRQLTDLRERLDRGPKQIRAHKANVARLEAELKAAKEQAKNGRMTCDRKQLELKTGDAKLKDLRTKLNTSNSNKEYQALLDQIAAAEMAGSVLADEILEGLESVDELDVKIAEAEQRLAGGREELAKIESQVAAKSDSLKTDVTRLEQELGEAEKDLPPDFRRDYDRIIKSKGEDALAVVDGDVCGGCYQRITANQQNDLYMGRAVFCRSCGRLIYLPEDRQPVIGGN